jgi:hypothetical protein
MSKKKRSKNSSSKKKYKEPYSTFDPKIHHRGKGGSGYGLKRDHVSTPEESSGSQLKHIFGEK